MLWYVPTQPSLGVNALLVSSSNEKGIELLLTNPEAVNKSRPRRWPVADERLRQVGPVVIRSFHDLATVQQRLRSMEVDPGGRIEVGQDPSEDPHISNRYMVEYPDHSRLVRVWSTRNGSQIPVDTWIALGAQQRSGLILSMMWFVLQGLVVLVGVLACWYRPFDDSAQAFLAMACLALIAYMGGNHWWVICASPVLMTPFVVAGVFLPAVILHFALVYPVAKPMFVRRPLLIKSLIYGLPAFFATAIVVLVTASRVLSTDWGTGPFAMTLNRLGGGLAAQLLPVLRILVYVYLSLMFLYFLATVGVLWVGLGQSRSPIERKQVQVIVGAAAFGVLPLSYCVWLAASDPGTFAFGGARLPAFLASIAFMFAYGIGIVRYKLLLLDQMFNRNVWYYVASAGTAILFSAVIAVGGANALHQNLTLFGQAIPVSYVLLISVLMLIWGRDAIQRALDRRFFREKYRLDRALQRMNRVVASVFEREAVAESLLNSCCDVLRSEHALLYLRKGQTAQFQLLSAHGRQQAPLKLTADEETISLLTSDGFLQRIPSGRTPSQLLLRQVEANAFYGMELDGVITGLVAVGPKPNGSAFTAEDVAFLTAMGRMTAIALHCAKVHEDVGRLNDDLQVKMEKISEQSRQIQLLQAELSTMSRPEPVSRPAGDEPRESFQRGDIKGNSPAILRVLETARKVAGTESTVLIRGESGTGKELLARALHENSSRKHGPLVSVHCAALSPTLLESELFGHVKGAFTDAREDKPGRFAMAHGGTLFLDEIGDISAEVQVKLLRVLQERTIEPVGSTRSQQVDVRLITATHQQLEQLIAGGRFREDLFYRLNVISMTLPPLREREDDVLELVLHFLQKAARKTGKLVQRLSDDVIRLLLEHPWPGNIRELQNVIERAVVLAETDQIEVHDLPPEIRSRQLTIAKAGVMSMQPAGMLVASGGSWSPQPGEISDERELLEQALKGCEGNKAEAARSLGMPRSTFFSKLKKHGLN